MKTRNNGREYYCDACHMWHGRCYYCEKAHPKIRAWVLENQQEREIEENRDV